MTTTLLLFSRICGFCACNYCVCFSCSFFDFFCCFSLLAFYSFCQDGFCFFVFVFLPFLSFLFSPSRTFSLFSYYVSLGFILTPTIYKSDSVQKFDAASGENQEKQPQNKNKPNDPSSQSTPPTSRSWLTKSDLCALTKEKRGTVNQFSPESDTRISKPFCCLRVLATFFL